MGVGTWNLGREMNELRKLALAALVLACIAGCDGSSNGSSTNATCSQQMYAKYGQAGFEAVTHKIIENIAAVSAEEPSPIGDSFKGLSAEEVGLIEANLLDFLVKVYGGPDKYAGRDMKTAHHGLGITQSQYDAFVNLTIVPALQAAGVSAGDISDCFAPPVTSPEFSAMIVGQ